MKPTEETSNRAAASDYGKYHKAYIDNLNTVVMETEFADLPLEKITTGTAGRPENAAIFNTTASCRYYDERATCPSFTTGGNGYVR